MTRIVQLIIALSFFLAAQTAVASDIDMREHISVSGSAEVKVVPNEFVIRATLTTFDKSLESAAEENDKLVARVFRDVTKLGVPRKYVVTDDISVTEVTEGYIERGNFKRLGFTVSRDIMVVLHDAKRIEPAMKKLFGVGVQRLTVSPGHTKMEVYLEQAQVEAAKAAAKRGRVLAGALGRTIGQALSIEESSPGHSQTRNFVYGADTPDLGDTMSLGKVKVQAAVAVKFALK